MNEPIEFELPPNDHYERLYDEEEFYSDFDSQAPANQAYIEHKTDAEKIAEKIQSAICKELKIDKGGDNWGRMKADSSVINSMISSSFWSGIKSRVNCLNGHNSLVVFPRQDGFKFLQKIFGYVTDEKLIADYVSKMELEPTAGSKLLKSVMTIPDHAVMDYIMLNNQREKIDMRVDMFAKNGRVDILDEKARVVFPHVEFESTLENYNTEIVDDYKSHFPRLSEFINFIVAARFSRDRKKAYLWMRCDSDWGKGFLIGILNQFNCTVDLSIPEVEKLMSGSPVGKSMQDFKRAMVLSIDEFKCVNDEIKRLQNEIEISPKNQLSVSVEIFAKIFTSAEDVPSLAGEHGIEDQFANRFSLIANEGSLDKREVFTRYGRGVYFDNVASYFAGIMNSKVNEMIALGKSEAETRSDAFLTSFHSRHGIDKKYQRFSTTLPEICTEMIEWLKGLADTDQTSNARTEYSHRHFEALDDKILKTDDGSYYIKSHGRVINEYLGFMFDRSQIVALKRKKKEIVNLISGDDKPGESRRLEINGKSIIHRSLKLK